MASRTHLEIIASSRPNGAGGPPPRPPRAPPPPPSATGLYSSPSGLVPPAMPAASPSTSRTPSPLNSGSRSHYATSSASAPHGSGGSGVGGQHQPSAAGLVKQAFYASLPGAPPLLPPSSASVRSLATHAHSRGRSVDDATADALEDAADDNDGEDDGGSDASSFRDEELVDLGSSSEDEFLAPPVVVRAAGAGGDSSAESLGRVVGGGGGANGRSVRDEKALPPAGGGVRDWLGVTGLPPPVAAAPLPAHILPPRQTSSSSATPTAAAPPPRTSSARTSPPLPPAPAARSHSHGRAEAHERTPSQNDRLRRELPALHTHFDGQQQQPQQSQPHQQQQSLPAMTEKEREHMHYQQLQAQQATRQPAVVSPPPYAHSPPSASSSATTQKRTLPPPRAGHAGGGGDHDDVHAHRDGYTNSPSLFRLPDLTTTSSGGPSSRLLGPSLSAGGSSALDGGGGLSEKAAEAAWFDPTSFELAPPPSGLIGTLVAAPRALRTVLQELPIRDVLSLWHALGKADRERLEGDRQAVEEGRVWALGWAGYVRGAMDGAGSGREAWDKVGWSVLLEFVASLLEPPTTAFPPSQVLAISLSTLLLRASHARLPPAGPHLIPFEEEDVLPPALQPTLAALNPKTRMRGLPAGRLLVLPSPLAAQPQQAPPSGSQSALDGRNGLSSPLGGRPGSIMSAAGGGSLRTRRSSLSESVGIHWGASRTRVNLGMGGGGGPLPPSAFSPSTHAKLGPSSASIYSVDNHSKARLAPPPPRLPEARRYEFPQPLVGQPGRRHRRQASDSQSIMSTATTAYGNGIDGGGGASMHRQRGVSAGPASSASHHGGGSLAHGVSSPDLGGQRAWLADPANAPPLPSFAQPLRKSASKDGSWSSFANGSSAGRGGGGGSHSASASFLGGGGGGSKWETTTSGSESSSGRITRRRSETALVEPLFLTLTSPFKFGRAPLVKIVVPFPADVAWPSGPALKLCHRHLDSSGLLAKMKVGDLVENLAVSWRLRTAEGPAGTAWTTGTMVFIPPFLHPLSTTHAALAQANAPSPAGSPAPAKLAHLPASLNMFLLPPSYYHGVVPPPHIIYLDLQPFAAKVADSLRLANQRAEVLSAGGDVLSLDQWVHEAGFFVGETGEGGPWEGTMVTLEADGTKEGKDEILRRVDGSSAKRRPWEIVAAKSTRGSVWLKLVRESLPTAV